MGDQPVLDSQRLQSRYDFHDLMRERAMPAEARLQSAINFDRFGSELAIAGAKARAENAAA